MDSQKFEKPPMSGFWKNVREFYESHPEMQAAIQAGVVAFLERLAKDMSSGKADIRELRGGSQEHEGRTQKTTHYSQNIQE